MKNLVRFTPYALVIRISLIYAVMRGCILLPASRNLIITYPYVLVPDNLNI